MPNEGRGGTTVLPSGTPTRYIRLTGRVSYVSPRTNYRSFQALVADRPIDLILPAFFSPSSKDGITEMIDILFFDICITYISVRHKHCVSGVTQLLPPVLLPAGTTARARAATCRYTQHHDDRR